MTSSEYQSALEWLYSRVPNYQEIGAGAYKPGLENIKKLCEYFGNPQEKFKNIHVAGTNGKGSVCHMLSSVLQKNGYKTGLYTSPHLVNFTERAKINGQEIPESWVYAFILRLKNLPEEIRPSFFEFTTVMAFTWFAEQEVDIAVIETGLGGRLDATNILSPIITVITSIDLDHQDLLGETLEDICKEKAGIIKPNTPVVSGVIQAELKKIIQMTAEQNHAKYIDAEAVRIKYETDLQGWYQKQNLKTAVGILRELSNSGFPLSEEKVRKGLLQVQATANLKGRWQIMQKEPYVVCDTGHNEAGLSELIAQWESLQGKKYIILGFVKDKKVENILKQLPKSEDYHYIFTRPEIQRGRNPQEYENEIIQQGVSYQFAQNVMEAYHAALKLADKKDSIFIGGSNFLVGDFLKNYLQE